MEFKKLEIIKEVFLISSLLKDLREKNGYTQEQIAKFLGYSSKSGYCMLETGKVKLSLDRAKKLSQIYNVNIQIFFKQ